MSNYTKTTDFEAKDSLPSGDSGKIIKGAEFETEFDAISTAIATKADADSATLTGTTSFETLSDGTISVTAFVDEDDMSSDSATLVPTQQSVKAYVDSQVTAQDLDFQADSGGALSIDLDSEALTLTGGTGIDTSGALNEVTFAIDSTVATLTGTQTLTNKTLTSPDVNTPDIDGGTIDGTVIGGTTPAAVSATTVSATGNITVGGTVDGRDVAADGTKLDGIESGATADQTAAEIRTLVDSATDSNVFTDADHTKLDGIEANATADQTAAEIRTLVEAATDSNVFTDADHTKLDGIEASADVTDTANVTAAGALMDSELTNLTAVKALNQGVATTDSPTFAGLTTTADVSFGDNDKAIFGAGSDLQIYHDGSNSYVTEGGSGTGNLIVQANNLFLRNGAGTVLAGFYSDGTSRLLHNGSTKLDTTSSGIDVTGTVTADGLKVNTSPNDGFVFLEYEGTSTANQRLRLITGDDASTNSKVFSIEHTYQSNFNNASVNFFRGGSTSGGFLTFDTNGAEAMRIDSSGNVGIGTDSPATNLEISDSSAAILRLTDSGSSAYSQVRADAGTLQLDANAGDAAVTEYISMRIAGSEAMRIDSSGNLLVGKTASNTGVAGMELRPSIAVFTADGDRALQINRLNSDGELQRFIKDGSTVGSIGTLSGDLTIGTGDTGLGFLDGGNFIQPHNMTTNAVRDAAVDLGTTSGRFKDIYLSGGVYLGGTGSANKLDDYEEGDYDVTITCGTSGTVTLNSSFNRAQYTKVGRTVHVSGFLVVSAVSSPLGYFTMNLPFTPANLTDRAADSTATLVIQNIVSANISDFMGTINEAQALIYVQLGDNKTIQNDSAQQMKANSYISFSATYAAA